MILEYLIEKVQYPDEEDNYLMDQRPYYDLLEGLKRGVDMVRDGKIDMLDTIAELERRWEIRQDVKKSREIIIMYNNDNPLESIARSFNATIDTIIYILRLYGFKSVKA